MPLVVEEGKPLLAALVAVEVLAEILETLAHKAGAVVEAETMILALMTTTAVAAAVAAGMAVAAVVQMLLATMALEEVVVQAITIPLP